MRRVVLATLGALALGCRPSATLLGPVDATADVRGEVALADTTSDHADTPPEAQSLDVPTVPDVGDPRPDVPVVPDTGNPRPDVPTVPDTGDLRPDVPTVVDVGVDVVTDVPPFCAPGSATCGSDGSRLVCEASGSRWSSAPCAAGETCASGTCVDPLARGLVARYAFDGNVDDSSGAGAPSGVIAGAVPDTDRCGHVRSAYRFNGAASIAFPTNPRVPVGGAPRTLALWWKTSDVSAGFRTAANWGLPVTLQRFQISASGRVVLVALATYGFHGTRVTSDGAWHSVVAAYDGTTTRLYVDGTADGSETRTLNTMGQSLMVGRAVPGNPTDEFFVGTIDDVRVYDRALSPGDVASLSARGPCAPWADVFASFSGPVNWDSARADCVGRGGDLAHVESATENAAASEACEGATGGPGPDTGCWMGAQAPFSVWQNGRPVSFTNWSPGEPSREAAARCLWMYNGTFASSRPNSGRWDDQGCGLTVSYLCRLPDSSRAIGAAAVARARP